MAQSRYSAATDQAIGTRAGRPRRVGQAPARLAGLRGRGRGAEQAARARPARVHHRQGPGARRRAAEEDASTHEYGKPSAGNKMWWGGKDNNLDNTLTRAVDLTGATTAALTLKARYETEAGLDYVYAQASTDGGATWTSLDGTVDGKPFGRDASGTPVLDGSSGGKWVDVAIPLDRARRQAGAVPVPVPHRRRRLALDGFFADEITITADGAPVVHRRRRDRRARLDASTASRRRPAPRPRDLRPLLHRVEPRVRRLRQVPEVRAVQLRVRAGQARPRGALPVPERPAGHLLGHVPAGQQHQQAPGPGQDPAGRRASGAGLQPRRRAVAGPDPGLRRPVRPAQGRLADPPRGWQAELHPRAGPPQPVFDDTRAVLGPGAAGRRRQAARGRASASGSWPRAAPR